MQLQPFVWAFACDPTGLATLGMMVWQTEIDALDQS